VNSAKAGTDTSAGKITVLVAEDEVLVRLMLAEELREQGHETGLIAYECPQCGYLTSVLVPPNVACRSDPG
jgi:hypothetical protein